MVKIDWFKIIAIIFIILFSLFIVFGLVDTKNQVNQSLTNHSVQNMGLDINSINHSNLNNVIGDISFDVSVRKVPKFYSNAFIFTMDDLTLADELEYNITSDILELLKYYDVPATFFAIPNVMNEYNFSENIEIAQHGFTHLNPYDLSYKEYKNIPVDEFNERLVEGKLKLENLGYEIYGHRAPMLYLTDNQSDVLKEIYVYDSSYRTLQKNSLGTFDEFHIPLLWLDLNMYMCFKGVCSQDLMQIRKSILYYYIDSFESKNEPLVMISHFWPFFESFKHPQFKLYYDDVFSYINSKNYWKTTMHEYVLWQEQIEKVNFEYYVAEDFLSENIVINFDSCVQNLSFDIVANSNFSKPESINNLNFDYENLTVFSNCDLSCIFTNSSKTCMIK
jgi:peptidoglycan/xylan/chitin deacetylase (PgdA/CDA1 family)